MTMSLEPTEVVTVLTMELPSDVADGIRRHARLRGAAALQVARMMSDAGTIIIRAEEAPTNLADAMDHDIDDVLGGIPPECPICGEYLEAPHSVCERRVRRYLAIG